MECLRDNTTSSGIMSHLNPFSERCRNASVFERRRGLKGLHTEHGQDIEGKVEGSVRAPGGPLMYR